MTKVDLGKLLGSLDLTPIAPGKTKGAVDLQQLSDTPLGGYRTLRDAQGTEWAVIRLEDLEDILSLANLRPQDEDKDSTDK